MAFGSIYPESWWGNANEANAWGIIYPLTAGGSDVTVATTSYLPDTTSIKADATEI
jgi:hypothetical protein